VTVYVDPLVNWGWVLRGHRVASCHMFSDQADLAELHDLASRIPMRRTWFQQHRIAPHYDLTASRRNAALLLGAIAVDRMEAVRIWRARKALMGAGAAE
jgi:hypothetical protein